jgi:aspartate kinase
VTLKNVLGKEKITQDTPSLREMDVLLTTGEQVSISLLAMALQQLGRKNQ